MKILWYDGGGIYFVGEKGTMVCGGWSGSPTLYPQSRREECPRPERTIPRSSGHRSEWIQACKDGKPEDAQAGFAYSGPFTESLLVGNLAVLLQKRIEWNAQEMVASNAPEAEPLIRKKYRAGFGI